MTATRDGDPFSRKNIPSLAKGHGIIQLDSVLAFNTVSPLLRFLVVDRKSLTRSEAPRAMAPQVTLSWTDPLMRTTQPSLSTLVNDLQSCTAKRPHRRRQLVAVRGERQGVRGVRRGQQQRARGGAR